MHAKPLCYIQNENSKLKMQLDYNCKKQSNSGAFPSVSDSYACYTTFLNVVKITYLCVGPVNNRGSTCRSTEDCVISQRAL